MGVIQMSLRWLGALGRESVYRYRSGGEADEPVGKVHGDADLDPVFAPRRDGEGRAVSKDELAGMLRVPAPPGMREGKGRRERGRRRRALDVYRPRPCAGGPGVSRRVKSKHIVILVENLPVPFDRRPWQIAQALTEAGHRVSVICPKMYEHTRAFERLSGVDIYRYPSREGNSPATWIVEYVSALLWMSWLCLRLFLTRGIDAVHACNPPDLLFLVAWPYKVFFGARFMFDHHDLAPEVYLAKFGKKGRVYRALCVLERMTYRLADVALATNRSFKAVAVRRDGKRADRVFIVRNAPMAGRLVEGMQRAELRSGRKHLVAYLGVMNKQDGLDLLLESIHHIVHTHGRKDVAFALIGDGPEVPALKRRAAELELDGEVRFVGRLSDGRKISEYLNTATLCVCPDPKNEMNDRSTMTKVVEYMALGRPIVAYDLKETLYSAGDAAVYAQDNDPRRFAELIVGLLDNERRRRWMGLRGRERYEMLLSWERSREELLAAYRRLFGGEG